MGASGPGRGVGPGEATLKDTEALEPKGWRHLGEAEAEAPNAELELCAGSRSEAPPALPVEFRGT